MQQPSGTHISDGELVRQTLDGRKTAYEELVRRWAGRILVFCQHKVHSFEAGEDLAQEALLRGYRALATLSEPDKFGAWLRGIAQCACLDWLKSKQTHQVSFSVLGTDYDPAHVLAERRSGPDSAASDADEIRKLMCEVRMLPPDYREVLALYYTQGVTYRDLAEMLGVSAATVNARLTKARAMLRARMSGTPR